MLVLALPFLLILFIPIASTRHQRLRVFFVCLALIAFVLDSVLRHFISEAYQAAPDSSMVLSAVANTSVLESREFIASYALPIIHLVLLSIFSIGFLVFLVVSTSANSTNATPFRIQSLWLKIVLGLAIILCIVGYASKPWRKLHPLYFWPRISLVAIELRSNWHDLKA